MIIVICAGIFLKVFNLFVDTVNKYKKPKKECRISESEDEKAMKMTYSENDPVISRWIEQNNLLAIEDSSRKQISYWEYVPRHPEEIRIKFRGEVKILRCLPNIEPGVDGPYVKSAVAWDTNEQETTITLKGYQTMDFTTEQTRQMTELEGETLEKLAYKLKIANEVYTNGIAVFSILEYENFTEQAFSQVYTEDKLKALIADLTAEEDGFFSEAVLNEDGYTLTVC